MSKYQNSMRDRAGKLLLLVGIAIAVQITYTLVVQPRAAAWIQTQHELVATHPGYRPERSFFVIIKDREQQTTIIIATWAALLAFMQFGETRRQRKLLEADLLHLP